MTTDQHTENSKVLNQGLTLQTRLRRVRRPIPDPIAAPVRLFSLPPARFSRSIRVWSQARGAYARIWGCRADLTCPTLPLYSPES